MIKITSKMMGAKQFFQLYQLLKQKEFTINMGSLGVCFQKIGPFYYEISIVALGKDFGDNLYLTKENLIKKERVTIVKEAKPKKAEVVEHIDNTLIEKEDLF